MRKLFAVIKREYLQRVRTKFFIVATILGPLMLALFTIVPVYIANIPVGGSTRLAVIDLSGKLYPGLHEALTNDEDETAQDNANSAGAAVNANQQERMRRSPQISSQRFEAELVSLNGRTLEEVKRALNDRVRANELDGYVIIPANILADGKAEFYG